MFALIVSLALAADPVPLPPPIVTDDRPKIIPSPGTKPAAEKCHTCGPDCQCGPDCACDKPDGPILGKTETGWRVTYKSRQFNFTGDSKAAASRTMAAIVNYVDGKPLPLPMAGASATTPQTRCSVQWVNGRWERVCVPVQ